MLVKLQYFKESGKFYSSGSYDTDKKSYQDIIDEVREMVNTGTLPDLQLGSIFTTLIAPNMTRYAGQYYPVLIHRDRQ